ncbi:MAG: sugar phosphate isomerase/epimerase [Clostridium sp.]|nr:sugar phosphate isomerase/epimerase [Clostridium sp.]
MEIGLSSAVFYPNVLTENSIEIIKSLGFDCAEIFLNSPCEFKEDFAKILLEKKDSVGLNINSVHAFSSLFEPYLFDSYKRRRKDMTKFFSEVCKVGKMLGASCYTFHGPRLKDMNSLDMNVIYECYDNLLYIAGENEIKLAQENVSWCMSSNLQYLSSLLSKVKYPLYFTFDIKQAYKAGVDPMKYLDIMDKKLINFHANDRDENNVCLLPGKGNVDFKSIFEKIKSQNYSGNIMIEVYANNYKNYNELEYSRKFLEKTYN